MANNMNTDQTAPNDSYYLLPLNQVYCALKYLQQMHKADAIFGTKIAAGKGLNL